MARGHGIIINLSSGAPFTFTYNPETIDSQKKINYAIAPNIGGAFKKKYFSGFDTKTVSFSLECIDMENPNGVNEEISFFETLREPDPGILGFGSLYGNQNYPPPQVIFQFGQSYIPLVWDVDDIQILESHFYAGSVRGVLGIPKVARISIKLSLDEGNVLNIANQMVKRAEMYKVSATSIAKEVMANRMHKRKEKVGMFKLNQRISRMY